MGQTIFHRIILDIPHIQTEREEYLEIFCGVLLVPHKTLMNMNNVMFKFDQHKTLRVAPLAIKG